MKVPIEPYVTMDMWRLTGAVKLRIYANRSFWNSDGQYVPQGTPGAAQTAYLEINASVAGNALTVEGFEIDSTVDALDHPHTTYTAELIAGSKRVPFLQNFPINTLQVGDPSLTWPEIVILKNFFEPRSLPDSLTRQIYALISLAVGNLNKGSETNTGVVAISHAATDPTFPTAVSTTHPLWQSLESGTGLVVEADTAVMVDGAVVVASAAITANSKVLVNSQDEGVTGSLRVVDVVPGVSFTIRSSNGGDNGGVSWAILS